MKVSLTRVVTFWAEHRYHVPNWSPEKNQEVFGTLGDEPGHGHQYRCGVTVGGPVGPEGMIMDLGLLDRILQEEIVSVLDGEHINLVLPEFAYGKTLPTCEALAAYFYPRLERTLPPGVILECVRLEEDPTLYADCTGSPPAQEAR
ncbi:MAG: 6-carboxytetrahydropterin synthase [Gemmatimonadales bacterium]